MKYLFTILLLSAFFKSSGQNVIEKVSVAACDCINKMPYDSTNVIPVDSVNRCITNGIVQNFEEIKKDKKSKIGTVEGIVALQEKVIKELKSKCPRMQSEPNKIETK